MITYSHCKVSYPRPQNWPILRLFDIIKLCFRSVWYIRNAQFRPCWG